jgi:type IV secretory pathway TraG/TraD family ATPase VirD4
MELTLVIRLGIAALILGGYLLRAPIMRQIRKRRYTRGRKLETTSNATVSSRKSTKSDLLWGNRYLPNRAATQHFLVAGTTGSGKSLVQKRLLASPLRQIGVQRDSRALIFDAKGDTTAYLQKLGVTCPVLSLNPFESRITLPQAVVWDIAKDITSPARAQNLATSLIPADKSGANQYFTDAARQVVIAVIESFIRHSGDSWEFSDLIFGTLCKQRISQILLRDSQGEETFRGFFGDERTGYAVFTSIVSKMSYYRTVAALWQRNSIKLSLRQWLNSESILLLGSNATAKTSLDAINEQIFRVVTEEIDIQSNSSQRRTWIWIDEARLSGALLKSDLLPYLAVKGRSRGVALVLAFQDMEGFREAAGVRIANELVAQCSHKALLRMESEESSSWASKVVGQFETLESFRSDSANGLAGNISEQRVQRDVVIASEFYEIPVTTKEHGLSGYFLSPETGVIRTTISGQELERVVTDELSEIQYAIPNRPEAEQWIKGWEPSDFQRLGLEMAALPDQRPSKRIRLKRDRMRAAETPVASQAVEVNRHSDSLTLPNPGTLG